MMTRAMEQAKDANAARTKRSRRYAQPPLTPMIDVVFQLLLFFLLSCQFIQKEGVIPARLPEIVDGPQVRAITVTILPAGVDRQGAVFRVAGDVAGLDSAEQLHARLAAIGRDPMLREAGVCIRPSGQVRWRHVVDAMNPAVRAEYKKVSFGTLAPEGERGVGT